MTSSAQYRIELVSADSESGESTMVRGPNTFGKTRRHQKYYRPRQRIPDSISGWKRLGLSISIFVATLMFLWMFVLSMMTAELFKRTFDLQRMTKRISAQTELLPEEMQSYMSMSKYMQKNQSQLNSQLTVVSWKISNVSALIAKIEKTVHAMEEKSKDFPDLTNVPSQVMTLSSSVAGLGSEVEDMKTSLSRFRDEEYARHQSLETLKSNIQTLTIDIVALNQTFSTLNDTHTTRNNFVDSANVSSIKQKVFDTIDTRLSEINESLSRRLRYAEQDLEKDHKMLIDLQESLVNITSQVMSLSQNTDESRANFNNLELKILEVREQLKTMTTKKMFSEITTLAFDETLGPGNDTNLTAQGTSTGIMLKYDTNPVSSVETSTSSFSNSVDVMETNSIK